MNLQWIREAEHLKNETEKSVLAYCAQAGLFPLVSDGPPTPVIAAVSGGADSMALLRILLALAPRLSLAVSACHVNHGLRGEAADRDEAFVRAECARLQVPLLVYRAGELGHTVPLNAGEEWARTFRYDCFCRAAQEKAALVATAHTQNDQAETLLFRLARGTGVHGAAGIPPVRGAYRRPLLCLRRADTERYCAAVGQQYVTDETNAKPIYARNRLRQTAVPAMEQANSAAVRNMSAFCDKMARVDAYFSACAATLLQKAAQLAGGTAQHGPWSVRTLCEAEPLVLEAALHRLIAPLRDPEEKYVQLLADAVRCGGAVQLRPDVRFVVQNDCLLLEKEIPPKTQEPPPEIPLRAGVYTFPGGYRVKVSVFDASDAENTQRVHKKDLKNIADYAKIPILATLRTRRAGDVFRPAGRGVSKTLKKLQNEAAMPAVKRNTVPLLAAQTQVLWLWDYGFADGLAPDEKTKMLLWLEQEPMEELK